jgi:hypothetical protein
MNTKNIIVGFIVILGVALGAYVSKSSVLVSNPATVRAVSSPDIPSPYFSFGGLRHWAGLTTMTTALSNTVCSIQSPAATTTLIAATANFTLISSSTDAEIGLGATNSATTTLISPAMTAASLTAGTQALIIGSSTASQLIVPPNYFINVNVGGGSVGGTVAQKFVGSCAAEFREIQ